MCELKIMISSPSISIRKILIFFVVCVGSFFSGKLIEESFHEFGRGYSVGHAIQAYYIENKKFPQNLSELMPQYFLETHENQKMLRRFEYNQRAESSAFLSWNFLIFPIGTFVATENRPNEERSGLTSPPKSAYDFRKFSSLWGQVTECVKQSPVSGANVILTSHSMRQVETWKTDSNGYFYFPRTSAELYRKGNIEDICITIVKFDFEKTRICGPNDVSKKINLCINNRTP